MNEGGRHCYRMVASGEDSFGQLLILILPISGEFRETSWHFAQACGDEQLVPVALLSAPFYTHVLHLIPHRPAGSKDWMIVPFPLWASWCYPILLSSRSNQHNFSSIILFHLPCFLSLLLILFLFKPYFKGEKKRNHRIRSSRLDPARQLTG